jgi:hypothetical protein
MLRTRSVAIPSATSNSTNKPSGLSTKPTAIPSTISNRSQRKDAAKAKGKRSDVVDLIEDQADTKNQRRLRNKKDSKPMDSKLVDNQAVKKPDNSLLNKVAELEQENEWLKEQNILTEKKRKQDALQDEATMTTLRNALGDAEKMMKKLTKELKEKDSRGKSLKTTTGGDGNDDGDGDGDDGNSI